MAVTGKGDFPLRSAWLGRGRGRGAQPRTLVNTAYNAAYKTIWADYLFETSGPSSQSLTPSIFTNTQTFHAATVDRGAVDLTSGLVSNGQTFFTALVSQSQSLGPDLLANSQSFFSPTLSTSVTVTHSLFSNSSSFFTARVGQDIAPAAISNSQSFYAPTVAATYQIEPLLIESHLVFYAPVIMQPFDIELLPALFASENHIIRPELRRFNPLPRRSRDRYAAREYVGR